jgi:uncharacterized protein YjlB
MNVEPARHLLADDGAIPNSRLALLVYGSALAADAGPAAFERLFASNGWTGSWRDGIYPFHHYHSNTHEVLGIYRGRAKVLFGGGSGVALDARAGDVVVIPAGVGHKRVEASADLGVVGAYPEGRSPDLCRGGSGERPAADRAIAAVPLPAADPVHGQAGPLLRIWSA